MQIEALIPKKTRKNTFLEKTYFFFGVGIFSLQANIRNTFFAQRSSRPSEVGVLQRHRQTQRQTDGHSDSMTDPAQIINRPGVAWAVL